MPFTLAAGSGTFALTGNDANFHYTHAAMALVSGSFLLAGNDAFLFKSNLGSQDFSHTEFSLAFSIGGTFANAGIFNLTGNFVGLKTNMPVSGGAYSLAGYSVILNPGLTAAGASYAISGRPAAFSIKASASATSFALSGRSAGLAQSHIPLAAGSGVFALAGNAASTVWVNTHPFGLYRLTGNPAALATAERVGSGVFSLTGGAAAQRHGTGMALGVGAFSLVGAPLAPVSDGDSGFFAKRLKSLIPRGWVLRTAPIFDAVLGGLGDSLANFYRLLKAVKQQTRIATATGWFLDLIGWDFLGTNYLRKSKETDVQWRSRIIREVLRPRAVRAGIIEALEDLTGETPKIYEPWNASDDGGGYGAVGGRIAYGQSGYYGSVVLPAQIFVTAYKTGASGIPNITGYGYGNGGYGVGKISYASLTQVEGEVTDAEIFDCVHQNIAAGVKAWVAIGAVPNKGGTSQLLAEDLSVIQTEGGLNLELELSP